MKMVMTLSVSESGCLYYNKRAGALLDQGAIIAHLDLDDASRIQRAHTFTGRFPDECGESPALPVWGDKLNQIYQSCRAKMDHVFAGYCLPDPFFQPKMKETIERMMTVLKDPSLPLLELQVLPLLLPLFHFIQLFIEFDLFSHFFFFFHIFFFFSHFLLLFHLILNSLFHFIFNSFFISFHF